MLALSHLRRQYDIWLAELTCHEFTKGRNLKPPSRSLLCNWAKIAWEALPVEMIKDSFKLCAITTSTDGCDDDSIHCFRPDQPCEEGRKVVLEEMDKLIADHDREIIEDPFRSDDNG